MPEDCASVFSGRKNRCYAVMAGEPQGGPQEGPQEAQGAAFRGMGRTA